MDNSSPPRTPTGNIMRTPSRSFRRVSRNPPPSPLRLVDPLEMTAISADSVCSDPFVSKGEILNDKEPMKAPSPAPKEYFGNPWGIPQQISGDLPMVPPSPVELLIPGTPPSGGHDINGIPIKHRNSNGAEVKPLLDRSRLFPPPVNPGLRRSSLKRGGPLQGEPGIEVTRWADDPIHETEILDSVEMMNRMLKSMAGVTEALDLLAQSAQEYSNILVEFANVQEQRAFMNIRGATGDYESNPNFAGRSAALRAAAKFWGTMAQVQGNVSTLTVTSSKHMHMALQALLSAGRQSFMDDPYHHIEKIRQASHAKENETQVLVETPHVRDMILRMLISRSDDAFFGIEADITEHALKVTMAAFRGMETTLTDASECNADNFLQKSFNMIRKARISSSSETSVLHSIGSPSIGIKEVAIDMGDRRRSSLMEIYHEEVDGILKPETLLRREVQDDIDRLQRASHSRSEINKLGIQETARFQPAYHSTTTPKIDTKSPSPNDKIGTTSSSVTPVTDGGDKRAAALLYKTLNGLVNTIYKDTVIPEVLKNLRKDLESVIKSKGAAPVSRKDTERVTENNFPMDKRLIATAPETLSPDNPITQPLEPNLRDPPSLRRVGNLKLRPKPLEDLSVARYAGDKTAIQGANAGTPSPSTPHLASYLASVCNSNPTGDETPSEVYRVQTPTDSNLPIPRPSSLMNSNRSGHQVKPSPHCHTPVTMGPSFHHYHGQLMDRSATHIPIPIGSGHGPLTIIPALEWDLVDLLREDPTRGRDEENVRPLRGSRSSHY